MDRKEYLVKRMRVLLPQRFDKRILSKDEIEKEIKAIDKELLSFDISHASKEISG